MSESSAVEADVASFNDHRARLFAIAYRMLGTRADAEDVLQEAYLRWHQRGDIDLRSIEAWLVTVTTRLCIDRLRAAKLEREFYIGPWIPEPLVTDAPSPEQIAELASDLSIAFLMLLERLAPEERAAFLLREVFEVEYEDIATMLGKNSTACRQMVSRAKQRVQVETPRFPVNRKAHLHLLENFMQAAGSGGKAQLMSLFDENVKQFSDGGGKVHATLRVMQGVERLTRFYEVLHRNGDGAVKFRVVEINGEPGLLRYTDGELDTAISIVTDGFHIFEIYAVRNPDKLSQVPPEYRSIQ